MEKIIYILLLLFTTQQIVFTQNVGISTSGATPDASAILDVSSNDKGILTPRMTSAQRTSIIAPAIGLLVFDNDTDTFWFYDGTQWIELSNYWSKNGIDIYNNNTGNVGIGTLSPNTQLHVKSINANAMTIEGGNQLYITLNEAGTNVGYIGSFAGNPTDVELGTFGGNTTGSVILTTNNTPKLTVNNNGNVGIGIAVASEKLHIDNGKIRIADGTQGASKILTSDAKGVGSWVTYNSIKPTVYGVFGVGANLNTGAAIYTTASITLPPGKWSVLGTFLLNGDLTFPDAPLNSNESVWVRTYFSDSNLGAGLITSDYEPNSSSLISGALTGPEIFGLANGIVIIENSTIAPKTYYLWSSLQKMGTTPASFYIGAIGSSFWGENQIVAIPMN